MSNLIPLSQRTKEEQREIASKGGKASAAARRRAKTMREAAKAALQMEAPGFAQKDAQAVLAADVQAGEKVTIAEAVVAKMVQKAIMEDDVQAADKVFKWAGEDVLQVKAEGDVAIRLEIAGIAPEELREL